MYNEMYFSVLFEGNILFTITKTIFIIAILSKIVFLCLSEKYVT